MGLCNHCLILYLYISVSHTIHREIRQEVAFLSALDHPHLTQLCGVRTQPYICMLLELAPLGSLRVMLKEYLHNNLVLESLTLKATTLQVLYILYMYIFIHTYMYMYDCTDELLPVYTNIHQSVCLYIHV